MQKCPLISIMMPFYMCGTNDWAQETGEVVVPLSDKYIREWLVLGPFFPDDLDTDFLADMGGEANIEPREGDAVGFDTGLNTASPLDPSRYSTQATADGRMLTWKRYKSKTDIIDLLHAVGEHEHATAYAFCVLRSETAGDVQISLGSDDGVAVWINGQQVHSNPVLRSLNLDEDVFEVSLKAGDNRCLVKVFNDTDAWGFVTRVTFLPPNRAVLSGIITDEKGQSILNADVRLEQDGREILQAKTDASGSYRMSVYPVGRKYNLSVTAGVRGDWKLDIPLREDDRKNLNFTLKEAISISGTLLMLDDKTPHVAVVVQAVTPAPTGQSEPTVVATTLSDEAGRYRFINLKPGQYQVRCYTTSGYVYYQQREVLHVQRGKAFLSIDFRFAPFKKGVWRNYTPLDGLAFDAVNRIYVEPNGVMWFGTENGISQYDGKTFVNFTTEDGFSNAAVWAIHRNPDGVMWFGTWDAGVSRYDGKGFPPLEKGGKGGFINFTTQDGLANNTVLTIDQAPDGAMWFWTARGDVSRYEKPSAARGFASIRPSASLRDAKAFINFPTIKEAFASNYVVGTRQDLRDSDGGLWVWSSWGGGVSRYDGKAVVNFTIADGLPSNAVRVIHREPDGIIWIGTMGGVSRYDAKDFKTFTQKNGLVGNDVTAISRAPDGVMWFGIWGGGVSRYDGKGFVNFTTADGLLSNVVKDLHLGDDGVLWVATGSGIVGQERGGISRYDAKGLVNFTTQDGLVHNHVLDHYQDSEGLLWIGTSGGVSRYDGHQFKNFTTEDGLTHNTVTAISRSLDGTMWFATSGGGISRYDGKAFVNFTTKDGLANNIVTAIHCDPDGVLWFGTGDHWRRGYGVSRYDANAFPPLPKRGKGGFINFTTKDGLAGNSVLAIDCFVGFDTPSALNPAPRNDRDGMMWFGTRNNGVSRYDGKRFVNFTTKEGLAHNWVRAIHQDPDGIMWFGTAGGVSRYDGNGFANFTTKDGLAGNSVLAIHRHTDGIIWFGTSAKGVSGYDGVVWASLDTRDGLAGNTVGSISQAADGSLWFGTDGGMTRYRRSHTKPKVHIVSVTTDQTYHDLSAISAVKAGTRVTIKYISIDFKTVPEKRQYRCRIKEIDSDWHPRILANSATKATSFDYTFDKPGTYTFEVQAIDRDLNYSEPAMLSLTVQPDPLLFSLQTQLNHLRREVGGKYHFENIIGRSAGIKQLRALMEKAIDSGLTVLITGETGTGKELVAKAIHYNSPRKGNPLLDLNCGAVPKDLVASTLFGHRKGAFTGANEDKMGLFETASGGTVLLDEISEMPQDAQIHLLRVLEERKVQRLGEHISRDVDVRIIAMTNRDIVKEVEAGRFREDLYYRLSEFPIYIPPLRERVEDIPILAEHFLQEIDKDLDGFALDVFEMLQSYPWPGNVRELRNVIRRAAAFVEEGLRIHTYHFPSQITRGESLIQESLSERVSLSNAVDSFQRRLIEDTLRECGGNRAEAARMLGIHRPNLVRLMKRLGIE